ncbi:MAG: hypothetical protein ACYC6M_12565 [Terriglobales bacterium]
MSRTHSTLQRFCSLALLAVVPSALAWGGDLAPVLTVASQAYVNQHAVDAGAATRLGDELHTTADGGASLQYSQGAIELGSRTWTRLEAQGLNLQHGFVRVQGPLNVTGGSHRVTPLGTDARYELVALADGVTYLHVINGAVAVSGFAQPLKVVAGTAVRYQAQGAAGAAGSGQGAAGAGAAGAQGAAGAGAGAAGAGAGAAGAGAAAGAAGAAAGSAAAAAAGAAAAAAGVAVGTATVVAVGVAIAAAVVAGVAIHQASKSSSPSQPN